MTQFTDIDWDLLGCYNYLCRECVFLIYFFSVVIYEKSYRT